MEIYLSEKHKKIISSSIKELKEKYKVLAVYLKGSIMHNLASEDSDVDLMVIVRPKRENIFKGGAKPIHKTRDDVDFVILDSTYFIGMLIQGTIDYTQVAELTPIYSEPDFFETYKYIYKYKDIFFDKNELVYSLLGQLNNVYRKLSNESGKINVERIKYNKEVAKAYKYTVQFKELILNNKLYVIFDEEHRNMFFDLKKNLPEKFEKNEKGLTKIKEVLDSMRDKLKTFEEKEIPSKIVKELMKLNLSLMED